MSRICHLLGDSKYGGGSKIVLGLCERVISEGHEASILTTDPMLAAEIESIGGAAVRIDCIRRKMNPLWDVIGLLRLVRHLKNEDYDLVHTHTSKAGVIGRLASRMAGTSAVVHTVHGFAFHEQSNQVIVTIIAAIERMAACWCDRIVTVSRFHRAWALRLRIAPEDKLVAIPNGIASISRISVDRRREFRRSLNVAENEVLILGVGRLAAQKGFEDLLQAIPLVMKATTSGFQVRIAGEGPKRTELEKIINQRDIADIVELTGFSRDIDGLLGAADLIVQPSLWEGLSISLLEAMSASRAIITTTIESNIEVVGSTGCAVLVPVKDHERLAAAIVKLITNDDERDRLAARARRVYEEEYTEGRMHDEYMALYDSLLARGNHAPGENS